MPHIIISFLSFFIKMKGLSKKSPRLPPICRAAPSRPGRTAEQMGDQRRYKDQWCYFDRNMVVRLDGGQNQIGSCIVVLTAYPVEKIISRPAKGSR